MAEAHPVGFRWVDQGARARRDRHPRRPAIQPHVRARGSLGADSRRLRHRVFRRADQLRPHARSRVSRLRRRVHERVDSGAGGLRRARKTWMACSQAGSRDARAYDSTTWQYDIGRGRTGRAAIRRSTHPRTIYQQLVKHFARYTPEMVERACGIPRETFLDDRRPLHVAAPGPDRTATICYAVGLTQHSVGVQIIRDRRRFFSCCSATSAGRAAASSRCAGTRSIQGSTDIPTLYDLLPGYLPMPAFGPETATLARYIDEASPAAPACGRTSMRTWSAC